MLKQESVRAIGKMDDKTIPDPQVRPKSKRRRFTAKYKLRILEEVDQCTEPGEIGAVVRREGLYSSHLTLWRRQREQGVLVALSKKRGRKADPDKALRKDLQRLKRENEKLKDELDKAQLIITVQKKLSLLLGLCESDGKK